MSSLHPAVESLRTLAQRLWHAATGTDAPVELVARDGGWVALSAAAPAATAGTSPREALRVLVSWGAYTARRNGVSIVAFGVEAALAELGLVLEPDAELARGEYLLKIGCDTP